MISPTRPRPDANANDRGSYLAWWSRFTLLITALAAFACEPSAPLASAAKPECEVGTSRSCTNDDRDCDGTQSCTGAGAWSTCECATSRVGRACTTDGQCGTNEVCFGTEARFLDGSPSSGTCSLRCEADPTACERTSPASLCVVTDDRNTNDPEDDRAHCLSRCEIGANPDGKCHGRDDVACSTLADSSEPDDQRARAVEAESLDPDDGVCRPLCTRDEQCASGTCSLRTGACIEEPPQGKALGAPCDPDAEVSECAGICVEVDGAAFCSRRCVLGDAADCNGTSDDTADAPSGLCRYPEEVIGSVGDVGFCSLLCDCDTDCGHPDLLCVAFGSASLETLTGSVGVCTPRTHDEAGIACDPDAGTSRADASAADAGQ